MRRNRSIYALLAACVVFQSCIAAEFGIGLEAEGALAVEGAEVAGGLGEIEAGGGIAARIAAEAAESGEMLAPRGALTRALGELAENDSIVTIDRFGRIITGSGRNLATIESNGTLTAEAGSSRVIVGRVAEGELYEVSRAGARPIARLRGFVPSRGIRMMTGPGTGEASFQVLRDQVAAEILEVRQGWYEIRLPSGEIGWVWAPAVAALLIERGAGHTNSCQCQNGSGAVILKTGEIIQYQSCSEYGSAVILQSADGRMITVDRSMVEEFLCGNDARIPVAGTRVELATGVVLYADTINRDGTAALITMRQGERLSTESDLVTTPVLDTVPR